MVATLQLLVQNSTSILNLQAGKHLFSESTGVDGTKDLIVADLSQERSDNICNTISWAHVSFLAQSCKLSMNLDENVPA